MIVLKKVETKKDADMCYELSKLLIVSDRRFDSNIKEDFQIPNFYEKYYYDKNYFLMLALNDEEPIGFISAYLKEEAGNVVVDSTGMISGLYIKAEYRGRGIATELLEQAYHWCRGKNIKKVDINVYNENESAKKLYAKEGFHTSILRMTKHLD